MEILRNPRKSWKILENPKKSRKFQEIIENTRKSYKIQENAIEHAREGGCLTLIENHDIENSEGKTTKDSWFIMKYEECSESSTASN